MVFSTWGICISGQAAVITPQLVSSGLGTRKVKVVAVAKHHSIVVTDGGDVFTWGSNRGKQKMGTGF